MNNSADFAFPVQAHPVDRSPAAAARNGGGVEPSDWFSDLAPAIPGIIAGLSSLF